LRHRPTRPASENLHKNGHSVVPVHCEVGHRPP
jgi:hypothetical protein